MKQSDECGRQPWKVEFEPESQPVLNLSMKRKYNNRTGHFWNRSDVFLIVGIIVAIIAAVVVALK